MRIIGHRGASQAERENTPSAFATADEMGADGVELDVRLAPDGHGGLRLVVHHDPLPSDQAALDALADLDAVLDACGTRMLVNVEVKNSAGDGGFDPTMAVVALTLAALRRRGPAWARRWLISSFSPETIDHCRRVDPSVPTALLVTDPTDAAIEAAVAGGHTAIHPWEGCVDAARVSACHAAGLSVHVWTCNDEDRLRELASIGVDGVCTDVPDVALDATGRAGGGPTVTPQWGTRA